jgi:hypothetical protein
MTHDPYGPWFIFKLDRFAFAPHCRLIEFGDFDGEWKRLGPNWYYLHLDLRGIDYL